MDNGSLKVATYFYSWLKNDYSDAPIRSPNQNED